MCKKQRDRRRRLPGRRAGQAYGSGMFLQGNGQLTFAPGAGQVQQIDDVIADQTGVQPDTTEQGSYTLIKNGAGTTILTAANQYSGGLEVLGGHA